MRYLLLAVVATAATVAVIGLIVYGLAPYFERLIGTLS